MLVNYFRVYGNIVIRWWIIISQSTGTIQTYGALQSEGGLFFPREPDHCNQKVAHYFPENEPIAIRRWHIISLRTSPLHSDGG